MKISNLSVFILSIALLSACGTDESSHNSTPKANFTSFGEEVKFMQAHTEMLVLEDLTGQSKLAISPALQARVMTSASQGDTGRSYGWINRDLFASGDTLEHINPYGGEERFWLGPEGGQFAVFFKEGDEFTLEDWQTPALIDTEPFQLLNKSKIAANFSKSARITNYSGFTFDIRILRQIQLLNKQEIANRLGLSKLGDRVSSVAYVTTNNLQNTGKEAWTKEKGLLSIWLLGMFHPSPSTTIVIPFEAGAVEDMGTKVNDDYFGKVPPDRLIVEDAVLYFKGDGEFRSKIGLLPARAKNVLGSYDAENKILTIVKYNKPEGASAYVNSQWKIQEQPYGGDVINSYNDGAPEPGAKPLGPFYELETSSPALELAPGKMGTHIQETYHFEGAEDVLNEISTSLLGVSLQQISTAFLN